MMSRFSLQRLFGRLFGNDERLAKRQRPRSQPRLGLEALEDRLVPSSLPTIQAVVSSELQTVQAAVTSELQTVQAAVTAASNVSFSASGGGSAHWSHGKGSPIDLTIGSTPDTYAALRLMHVEGALPSSPPSFVTNNYNAGSPRWYITLDNGDYLFGYPTQAGADVWETNGPVAGYHYTNYAGAVALEGNAQVTGVYVIADADQAPGTTDVIDYLQYGGITYNS